MSYITSQEKQQFKQQLEGVAHFSDYLALIQDVNLGVLLTGINTREQVKVNKLFDDQEKGRGVKNPTSFTNIAYALGLLVLGNTQEWTGHTQEDVFALLHPNLIHRDREKRMKEAHGDVMKHHGKVEGSHIEFVQTDHAALSHFCQRTVVEETRLKRKSKEDVPPVQRMRALRVMEEDGPVFRYNRQEMRFCGKMWYRLDGMEQVREGGLAPLPWNVPDHLKRWHSYYATTPDGFEWYENANVAEDTTLPDLFYTLEIERRVESNKEGLLMEQIQSVTVDIPIPDFLKEWHFGIYTLNAQLEWKVLQDASQEHNVLDDFDLTYLN